MANKPYINQIRKDSEFIPAGQNLVTVADANKAALGLDAASLKELTDTVNLFVAKYNAQVASLASAKAATAVKDAQRKTTNAIIAKYIKIWRANAAIPDALLDQLDVAPHKTPGTKTAPTIPSTLQAKSDGQGNIELSWKPNGNKAGTQYLIQTRTSPSDEWTILGATTKTKSNFTWTVGSYFAARIIAQRDSQQSLPTVPVVLWDNGSTVSLEVAA